MEYSHVKGQYFEVSMVLAGRWNEYIHWMVGDALFLSIWAFESIGMKRAQICAWWIWDGWSKPLAHVLWCGGMCLMCVHFLKGEKLLSLSVNLGVHMFDCGIKWLLSLNFLKSVISLRDTVTKSLSPKSYNKPCMLIAFPRFWVFMSNDPDLEPAVDGVCCLCWFSIHVGSHFIHRSWFLWGLITGSPALPSPL